MSQISLTAPMRSNLLALQNIARQQDIVQNRLATGLKVSSAIDNPSAYYTAASLSNRAADLTALLDAMSQGVQTIQTASEAIDSATSFLEQAKATANQALEDPYVPTVKEQIDYSQFAKLDKSWYEAQVGTNGAVVETYQELTDAVAAGKETIVVYGNIVCNSQSSGLRLKANQKLVGTEYFADINQNALYRADASERFSQIHFNFTTDTGASGIVAVGNNIISDLQINLSNRISGNRATIYASGSNNKFENLDLSCEAGQAQTSGIMLTSSAKNTQISGTINIQAINHNGNGALGIYNYGGELFIDQAEINVLSGTRGILVGYTSHTNISNSNLNLMATYGLFTNVNAYGGNTLNINENVIINCQSSAVICNSENYTTNPDTGKIENIVNLKSGTKIYWLDTQNNKRKSIVLSDNVDLHSSSQDQYFNSDTINELVSFNKANEIVDDYNFEINPTQICQYTTILSQFDMLIADSSYKGINLLQGQNLQINFNEDRSSKVEVKGVKADSESLGLKTKEWQTQEDIEKSISELENAINTLRSFASAFGNYYSIVTTRQDFTENLINVLEEGADKLTLADMNEESANMLALQTSQQLAINSLSLASQAAQSVLKLF